MHSKHLCRKIILLYHSVGNPPLDDTMQLRVSIPDFQAQINFLHMGGWKILTISELISSQKVGLMAAVSFDDGYEDQIQAVEILENAGGRGTFFVIPGLFGGQMPGQGCWNRWRLMSPDQIRELSERGHEIGGHSLTHPGPLDQLKPLARRQEISVCRDRLKDLLEREVAGFSYPHGGINREVQKDVSQAGYRYACCSKPGAIHPKTSLFSLQRIEIRGRDSLETFSKKILGQAEIWRRLRYSLAKIRRL